MCPGVEDDPDVVVANFLEQVERFTQGRHNGPQRAKGLPHGLEGDGHPEGLRLAGQRSDPLDHDRSRLVVGQPGGGSCDEEKAHRLERSETPHRLDHRGDAFVGVGGARRHARLQHLQDREVRRGPEGNPYTGGGEPLTLRHFASRDQLVLVRADPGSDLGGDRDVLVERRVRESQLREGYPGSCGHVHSLARAIRCRWSAHREAAHPGE